MDKDYNKIAKYEKAIKDKYGEEAIRNPKNSWSKDKEQKYLEDLKRFYSKSQGQEKKETESKTGFTIRESKNKETSSRQCPVCGVYSFDVDDDIYMTKFNCCFNCYIQYVEDREERWKTGWRPNK